jgi:hypothetical protein
MAIWFCEMDFNCPKQWDELNATADPLIRECEECGKPVHFIDSQEELEVAAAKGRCIAFFNKENDDLSLEKRQELQQTSRRYSVARRITVGLPSRPMGEKLRAFIDTM